MYIVLSKKPRKTNRKRSARYRAKLKAKNTGRRAALFSWKAKNAARRGRLFQWKTKKARTKKKRATKR